MGTILTGLPPVSHGAVSRPHALAASAMLLSERFRAAGYASAASTGSA